MQSLKVRLYLLLAVALFALCCVGGMGVYNARQQAAFGDDAIRVTEALRSQMQADMMHDAIRGDVLNALRLSANGNPTAKERSEVEADLAEHVKSFTEEIAMVEQHDVAEVQSQLGALKSDLNAYVVAAGEAVAAAMRSKAEGDAAWPGFEEKFKRLEVSMGKFGDTIEKLSETTVTRSKESGQANLRWDWAVIGVSTVLLVVFGMRLVGNVLRQLGGDPEGARRLAVNVTNGKLDNTVQLRQGDDQSLMASMQGLSIRIRDVIADIQAVAKAQLAGDMKSRMKTAGLPGEFATLASEINALVDAQNADLMRVNTLVG